MSNSHGKRRQYDVSSSPSSSKVVTIRRDVQEGPTTLGNLIPNKSQLKQKVLSEEAYTSTLSKLIQRDFFPDLERLQAENAYLDALINLDDPEGQERLQRTVRRLVDNEIRQGIIPPSPHPNNSIRRRRSSRLSSRTQTPNLIDETPLFERNTGQNDSNPTPVSWKVESSSSKDFIIDDVKSERETEPSLNGLTIASFQSNYTSEDNSSFLDLLAQGKRRRKEAFQWAYDEEKKANEKRLKSIQVAIEEAKAGYELSLENAPDNVKHRIRDGNERKLITSKGEVGESKDYHSNPINQIVCPNAKKNSIGIGIPHETQQWSHKARNALFFGPDADRDTLKQRTSSLSDRAKTRNTNNENIFGRQGTQYTPSVNFSNTRLPEEEEESLHAPSITSLRSSKIDAAIKGNSNSSSLSSSIGNYEEDSSSAYDFVSPLPSPRPGDLGEDRIRQLMTWGTIVGTPRVLEKTDENRYDSSFKIPPTPKRDLIARQLSNITDAKRKRSRPDTPLSTKQSPGSSSKQRRMDLSPAARTLLNRTTTTTSLGQSLLRNRRENQSTSDRLRSETWTPSPRVRKKTNG